MSCVNKDKGPAAMKACEVSCIGCGKCEKECPFGAITVEANLAYIDPDKCRLCRKCEKVCPKHAIVAVNFPAPKPKPEPADVSAAPALSEVPAAPEAPSAPEQPKTKEEQA